MKQHLLAIALLLPLAGCPGTQGIDPNAPISQTAPATMLAAKKSLIAAHGLHEAAADALTAAANAKLCVAQCAITAKAYLDQSEAALQAADSLVALGDAQGIETKIAGATSLISQIQTLIGKK
jgi:hypothetical protein